jgi:hypothetical protein
MIRLAFVFIICLGCADRTIQNNAVDKDKQKITSDANSRNDVHETRLGESSYFILLPDTFKISEARGKEGQLGYNIIPRDTASTMFGFIEIIGGDPIGDTLLYNSSSKEVIASHFLNKKVEWKIDITETGYFNANTNEKGDLNAHASSKNRTEIDSLISIISTLRQK